MGNPVPRARRSLMITSTLAAAAICLLPAGPAFAAEQIATNDTAAAAFAAPSDPAAASAALAATPWQTTGAVDQAGAPVALDDPRAANFVGNAYFKTDGTFTMFNLDDSPKMHGDWEMRIENGQLVRWIAAKNDAGAVMFERIVPIVELTADIFTYRVVNAEDPSQWVDIVHTPTTHAEPGGQPPGTEEPGTEEPGTEEPGTEEPGTEEPGTEGPGSEEPAGDAPGEQPEASGPAAQGPESLAVTGGATPAAALAASALALLSGTALFAGRLLRRRLS